MRTKVGPCARRLRRTRQQSQSLAWVFFFRRSIESHSPLLNFLWWLRVCTAAKERCDVRQQLVENGRVFGPIPPKQLRALNTAKSEGWRHVVDQHRHQDLPPQALLGLLLHPVRPDRRLRPYDHDAARARQRLLNDLAVWSPERYLPIPPDRPAVRRGESRRQRLHPIAIFARVTDEYVAHRSSRIRSDPLPARDCQLVTIAQDRQLECDAPHSLVAFDAMERRAADVAEHTSKLGCQDQGNSPLARRGRSF